jgi:SAM-dependent methyltransferase
MTPPRLFDRPLLRLRQQRARRLGVETFLLARVADDIAERLSVVMRDFPLAVDIGSPGMEVSRMLAARATASEVVALNTLPPDARERGVLAVIADEEVLPLRAGAFDLAVSALALHCVNDLPGTLVQIRRALRPDGLFLAALLGGDTLSELRQAFAEAEAECEDGLSPRVSPFPDLRDLGTLLQRAGFALPVTDADRVTVRYASVFALMHDLRRMGATNVLTERRRKPLRRATLLRMAQIYAARFSDPDGRIRATFEIQWLSGWAPHESQQKPLAPGSATTRLADALGAAEISAGEKPPRD